MTERPHAYKKSQYEQAIALRKRGFTYTEIAKICAVSRGTVSAWCTTLPELASVTTTNKARAAAMNTVRMGIINKARTAERGRQYTAVTQMAAVEYKNYRNNPIFVRGLTLYMCHGDQSHASRIRFTTSSIEKHKHFIDFVTTFLGVSVVDIKIWLLLYPDHDPAKAMRRWSKNTGISVANFYKNQVIKHGRGSKTLQFGVGNTIIGSTLLKKKMQCWISLLADE